MMILRKMIVILILCLNVFSVNFKSIPFADFAKIVSNTSNYNIVISDTLDKDISLFLPNLDFYSRKKTLKLLKNILKFNNLSYNISGNVLYIYDKTKLHKVKKSPVITYHIVKFKNLSNADIKNYFTSLFPNIKYVILKGRIFFKSNKTVYNSVKSQLSLLDNSFDTKIINVTVLSTSSNLLKNKGLDFSVLKFNPSYYISLVSGTFTQPQVLNNSFQFYSFLHFLQSNNLTKIISNPQLVLSDQKNSLLESTTNIPFLTSSTSTKDNTTVTTNSYTYKDVGLKIFFKNVSITKTTVNFDLEFFIQNILDNSLTPRTSSKHIITHCTLSNNQIFFIGGLNSVSISNNVKNVPVLEYVPIINKITSHIVKTKDKVSFSIVLSIVNNSKSFNNVK